jgi:predicted amidophosphoribosyltransferase
LCVRCGSLQVQKSFFCQRCENEFIHDRLQLQKRTIEFQKQEYIVHFLINWIPEESDSLSEIVYLFKNRFSQPAWFYYSYAFYQLLKFEPTEFFHQSVCIIPVPSRKKYKSSYHTTYFSKALGQLAGAPSLPCLVSTQSGVDQKKLNLNHRSKVEFEFSEEFTSQIASVDQIIFVDDIITSGSTLQAAIKAVKPYLKKSCKIDIIALFSREKI